MVVCTCHHRTEKSGVGGEQVGWQPELHTKLEDIKSTMWDSVSEIKIMMIMVMIKMVMMVMMIMRQQILAGMIEQLFVFVGQILMNR